LHFSIVFFLGVFFLHLFFVPLPDLHFSIICLHYFSIFSRRKHPRTSAIRQHKTSSFVAFVFQWQNIARSGWM
jgi:hypothetical protein